jgi:hypothetical protein
MIVVMAALSEVFWFHGQRAFSLTYDNESFLGSDTKRNIWGVTMTSCGSSILLGLRILLKKVAIV